VTPASTGSAAPAPRASTGAVERFLGLFTEVRGGEGTTALLLTLNVYLLLTAYYIIKPVPLGGGGAFELVRSNAYLLRIALLMLVLNCVNSTGEYILSKVVSTAAAERVVSGTSGGLSEGQWIGKFYAEFFFAVNIVSVLTQLFLVSRILKYFGVRAALLCLPVIAFGGHAMLAFYPALAFVRWADAENSTDYSIRRATCFSSRRASRSTRRSWIDTFFVRVGDGLSAAPCSSAAFRGSHAPVRDGGHP
jgi:hypothetical protein